MERKRVHFWLTEKLLAELKQEAEKQKRSLNNLIEVILEDYSKQP